MSAFCGQCWHGVRSHQGDSDEYGFWSYCLIDGCACDGYEPGDDGSIAVNLDTPTS